MISRSPLFYIGDKYKLLPQLLSKFPNDIENYYEPFVGGGSTFLNVNAKKYYLNDIDSNLIKIHKMLLVNSKKQNQFFNDVTNVIKKYKLSKSYEKDIVPDSLKKEFIKTYYSRFNKNGYESLREELNKNQDKDPFILYMLLIFGFNRMLRFNAKGDFNIPVGNVDFNKNVHNALLYYFNFVRNIKITFSNNDFLYFLNNQNFNEKDFIYLDPPYLIADAEYNKIWDENKEEKLLDILFKLDSKNIKFALSNVASYQGKNNTLLNEWVKKFNVTKIKSNYINYHHNKQKNITEVLVTNF